MTNMILSLPLHHIFKPHPHQQFSYGWIISLSHYRMPLEVGKKSLQKILQTLREALVSIHILS